MTWTFSMLSVNYIVVSVYSFDKRFDILTLSTMSQQAQGYVRGH